MALTSDDIVMAAREKYPKISAALDSGQLTSENVVEAMIEKHPRLKTEYSPITEQPTTKPTNIAKSKGSLGDKIKSGIKIADDVLSQISYGVQDTLGMNPQGEETKAKTKTGEIARTVGKVGGYVAPIAGVELSNANEIINAGSKQISRTISKATAPITNAISGLTKKSISYIQGTLSSVTPEIYEHAINKELSGNSIFKGKFDPKIYEKIGNKVQAAVNYVKNQAGKEVGEAKQAIKDVKDVISTQPFIQSIDDQIAGTLSGEISSLTPHDQSIIKQIKGLLTTSPEKTTSKTSPLLDAYGRPIITNSTKPAEKATADRLLAIKTRIDDLVTFSPQAVKQPSEQGERILKGIRSEITSFLESKYPQLAEVNAKYSKIANIRGRLLSKLKDENVARNLKNIYSKDETTQSLFQELDELAPSNLKFMEQLKDNLARQPFEELFPGRGGGSGSKEGFANILRIAGVAHDVALLPLVSPLANKKAIQTAGVVQKAIPKVLESSKGKQALINLSMGGEQQ